MSILPCKNCGHTFFAHSEGNWRGCLDCPKTQRCHDYQPYDDAPINADPPMRYDAPEDKP